MKFRPYENKIWVLRRFFLLGSCGTIYLTMFVFQFILHIVKIWGTNTLPYPFTNGDTISIIMPILKAFLYFEGVDMLYVYDARRHICTPSSVMEKRFDFYVSCIQNYDKDLWGNFTAVVLLNKWLHKCSVTNLVFRELWNLDLYHLMVMQNNWFLLFFFFYLEVLLNLLYCSQCGFIIHIRF